MGSAGEGVVDPPVPADADPGGATRSASPPGRSSRARAGLRDHAGLVVVVGVYFALAVFVVPTLAPVPMSDDWVYTRAVERLVEDGVLEIPDRAVANLVFQIVWGAVFATVFGLSFGVLRVSSVVLTALGAVAVYGLARELEVDRRRAALAAAVYLFNPLGFVLSFSFMTDAVFTPLTVIAAYFYARGIRRGDAGRRAVLAGSVAASCAFLVRQQGLLVPVAVLTFLAATRRLSADRAGLRRVGEVALVPALTAGAFYAWLVFAHGIPASQGDFAGDVVGSGPSEIWVFLGRLAFIEVMYAGFFVLPLALLALPRLVPRLAGFGRRALWAAAAWGAVLAAGLVVFSGDRRMPYAAHFLTRGGLGPNDLIGDRPDLGAAWVFDLFTLACALAAAAVGLAVARFVGHRQLPGRAGAGLVVSLAAWQAIGAVLPSFHFRDWTTPGVGRQLASSPSLDRYLLPLLPLCVCLLVWALHGERLNRAVASALVATFAVVSAAGTRDALVLQRETWALAREARAEGVPADKLDAGAAWDGYFMNDASVGSPLRTTDAPWWIEVWAPAIDSTYVVGTAPIPGYEVVRRRPYSSWLHRVPTELLLQRRSDRSGPL